MSARFYRIYEGNRTGFHFTHVPVKDWKFFDNFYLWPALFTGTLNTYGSGEKYLYTRYISLYFLWWEIGMDIKYGKYEQYF